MTNQVTEQYDRGVLNLAGTVGHLTAEETLRLKELWTQLLAKANDPVSTLSKLSEPADAPEDDTKSGWFGFGSAKHKKGEPAAYRQTVCDAVPGCAPPQYPAAENAHATIRSALWAAVLCDHPDVLLLRFLRARKWDVSAALEMLLACIKWRIDEDLAEVIWTGESALNLALVRRGMGGLHRTDRIGQPVLYIPVRLNDPKAQPRAQMIRYTMYLMEVARFVLRPPIEKVCLLFDTTDMSMANMDWTFFKTFLHYLEHYYPECLGLVLIYNAPWMFNGLWKLIKPLLDPVVASKVHFVANDKDLFRFIAPDALAKRYGGSTDYEYKYPMPENAENAPMADSGARCAARAKRDAEIEKFEEMTRAWVESDAEQSKDREEVADRLVRASVGLDRYVRARTMYHRLGVIDGLDIKWNNA